ncbi:winged helix-turn-helix domain-containing protein [Haloarcula salinisoli]|uniref:Winged helix-turn-helix domain-containing protein n=1 Tax=Haloarcula salinisoli TaxID=2487746 RepID=A0A8J8C991_9EURY|nr:winged helix-turn-helix domain-containing protein [Halomicroarcula salinisoli]MBX0305366.1 winged helix-turn-helix domain-containing protein [Halomicroarcula salinisoli]
MVPLGERILELLRAGGWSTPKYIARKVSLWASVGRVRERCHMLTQAHLVEPLSQEFQNYDITGAGQRYLAGELDVSNLQRPTPSRVLYSD